MSAWIEIGNANGTTCGTIVALYMSAWIEILGLLCQAIVCQVALYMSAWIEIFKIIDAVKFEMSHST